MFLAQKRPKLGEYAGDALGILFPLDPAVADNLILAAL
jgi:hypothetical protein